MYSLWYQLTVALLDFTQKEENYINDNMITVSFASFRKSANGI